MFVFSLVSGEWPLFKISFADIAVSCCWVGKPVRHVSMFLAGIFAISSHACQCACPMSLCLVGLWNHISSVSCRYCSCARTCPYFPFVLKVSGGMQFHKNKFVVTFLLTAWRFQLKFRIRPWHLIQAFRKLNRCYCRVRLCQSTNCSLFAPGFLLPCLYLLFVTSWCRFVKEFLCYIYILYRQWHHQLTASRLLRSFPSWSPGISI
jgi:hypothetical protein